MIGDLKFLFYLLFKLKNHQPLFSEENKNEFYYFNLSFFI
jgi:hypothetical protein